MRSQHKTYNFIDLKFEMDLIMNKIRQLLQFVKDTSRVINYWREVGGGDLVGVFYILVRFGVFLVCLFTFGFFVCFFVAFCGFLLCVFAISCIYLFLTSNSRSVFRAGVSLNIHSFIHSFIHCCVFFVLFWGCVFF